MRSKHYWQLSKLSSTAFKLLTFLLLITSSIAKAETSTCYVYSPHPCAHMYLGQWTADNYEGSSSNTGRCMRRAQEYHDWCGIPNGYEVYAAYNVTINGVSTTVTSIAYKAPGNVLRFGYKWTYLP